MPDHTLERTPGNKVSTRLCSSGRLKLLIPVTFSLWMTACGYSGTYSSNDPRACLTEPPARCPVNYARYVDRFGCDTCVYLPHGEFSDF